MFLPSMFIFRLPEDDHRQSQHVAPVFQFFIILYMVCMTDNKLIICVNRNTPG